MAKQLALSGWYVENPITYEDRQLPDGTVVSAYAGLEEDGEYAALPPVVRFMAHMRYGHGARMEDNIRRYNARVPTGDRPHNIHDVEMRFLIGSEPADIETYFYPPLPFDGYMDRVTQQISALVEQLVGTELPVRSLGVFKRQHAQLASAIEDQLGINILPPPVTLEQFKSAATQGDRELIEQFALANRHLIFEETDIISGQKRPFSVPEYLAMIALRHKMVEDILESIAQKHQALVLPHVSLETPYLINSLLEMGLPILEILGWDGNPDFRFTMALKDKDDQGGVIEIDSPDKVRNFKGKLVPVTMGNPDGPEGLVARKVLAGITAETIPSAFWQTLARRERGLETCLRLSSEFLNQARWHAIQQAFLVEQATEAAFYQDNFDVLAELFHHKYSIPWSREFHGTHMPERVAHDILHKLVLHNGRDAALGKLKSFGYDLDFRLMPEESDRDTLARKVPQDIVRRKYSLFETAGLADPTWGALTSFLSNYREAGDDAVIEGDMWGLVEQGKIKVFCNLLQTANFAQMQSILDDTTQMAAIADSYQADAHIANNTKLDDQQKGHCLGKLYSSVLAQQDALYRITPAIAKEWFRRIPHEARLQFIRQNATPDRLLSICDNFGLPAAFTEEDDIQNLRSGLFPNDIAAQDFILQYTALLPYGTSSRAIDFMRQLLVPFIPAAFDRMLGMDQDHQMYFARDIIAPSGLIRMDEQDGAACNLVLNHMMACSACIFSPGKVAEMLKYDRNNLMFYGFYGDYLTERLTRRFDSIRDEVREQFNVQEKATLLAQLRSTQHANDSVRQFIEFVCAE